MLAQNESDPSLDRSLRTNSIKIILSAMWFTDTAGVDNILVEYRPAKADMTTPAYKFYSSIYRLCYSFHSSLEEIVDFVDTLRPKRLFSIALPDSTSEQQINEYFYDSNGQFVGFHNCCSASGHQMKRSTSFGSGSKTAAESPLKKRVSTDTALVLRKRKPFEFGNNGSTSDTSSNCSTSPSNSDNELVFGGESDEENNDGKRKKIKS